MMSWPGFDNILQVIHSDLFGGSFLLITVISGKFWIGCKMAVQKADCCNRMGRAIVKKVCKYPPSIRADLRLSFEPTRAELRCLRRNHANHGENAVLCVAKICLHESIESKCRWN